jgi:hypoxanthine phosphoribosyltransferase
MSAVAGRAGTVSCLIGAEEIAARVRSLGAQLSADYAGREPVLVGVLCGAWVFMADLVRQMTVPLCCDFVRVASYGAGKSSSGEVRLLADMATPAAGRELLVVEDIVDTGLSLHWLLEHLRRKGPAGVRVCTLLDKPSRRMVEVPVDCCGFTVPDRFVVGYGIDCDQRHRQLPYVGYLSEQGSAS